MPLTDIAIKKVKPTEKVTKLFDERGLYLQISRNGGKWWRLKYRFDGKEKKLALGGRLVKLLISYFMTTFSTCRSHLKA